MTLERSTAEMEARWAVRYLLEGYADRGLTTVDLVLDAEGRQG